MISIFICTIFIIYSIKASVRFYGLVSEVTPFNKIRVIFISFLFDLILALWALWLLTNQA